MPDFNRLRVLIQVARRGSFSAAAEALFLTQPAVSRQIAALEQEVGIRLVVRGSRGVQLTQAGVTLVGHAEAILARVAAAEAQVRALRNLDSGQLRMAAFASANSALVPAAIARLRASHPGVEVFLTGIPSDQSVSAIRAGELDLALVTRWDMEEPDRAADLLLEPLLDDALFIALHRGHPLARGRSVRLIDLRDEIWIEGAHPDCLGPLDQLARAGGFQPRIGFHCDDWTGKQALVAAGAGIALFPSLARTAACRDLVLRPLTPSLAPRQVFVAAQPQGAQMPAVGPMLQILRALARAPLPLPRP